MWPFNWHIYIWPLPILKISEHFNCEYLAKGDTKGKHCYYQKIESRLQHFYWNYHLTLSDYKGHGKIKHISTVNISQTVEDKANITIVIKNEATYWLSICTFRFSLGPFWRWRSRPCTFRQWISLKWWQIGRTLLLPWKMKSHKGFRLAYLDLTLAYLKCQGQGHAHFDCKYL